MPHEPTPRILFVVDDDELVRALSARFENLGYRCAVATAADACRGPRADGVDLVIAAPEGPAATVVDLVHGLRAAADAPIVLARPDAAALRCMMGRVHDVTLLAQPLDSSLLLDLAEAELATRGCPIP
ncbi:MAG: hypothetical protein ACYTG1_04605 [Planctomycetota bacterium]|jgi:DNA-binding response OmpR family regulator